MNKHNLKALIFDMDGVIGWNQLRRAGADETFENFEEIRKFLIS